jgi:pseudaminic acid cytidylyltransferase
MSTVAIIPARGGSKRIPRKNVKRFAGLPMIAHSIGAAQRANVFDRIVVSTDDDEIAGVAVQYGAEVPFRRPVALSDDFATTDAVLGHAVEWLAEHGETVEYFCCIYATAPFLRPEYLLQGLKLLRTTGAATAFSVATYQSTIFRALKLNERGRLEMLWPENRARRSQDLAVAYHDAGQFYWADADKYRVQKQVYSDDAVPVVLPRRLVQDIDTQEDWEAAERMYEALRE